MNCFFVLFYLERSSEAETRGDDLLIRIFPLVSSFGKDLPIGHAWNVGVPSSNPEPNFFLGGGWKRREVVMGLLRSQKRRRAARTKPTSLEILHCVLTYNPTGCWALSNTCCGTWCLIRQSSPSPPVCSRWWSDCPEPASTPNVLGLVISWAKTVRSLTT